MSVFTDLQNVLSARDLHLRLLIAPPRTGSTMLEASLSRSPNVSAYAHEPFVRHGYYGENADSGYGNILDAISQSGTKNGNAIVVKEMSHWISPGQEYQRLFTLTDGPVLFLTRNPLLSAESRLRKVTQNLNIKHLPAIHRMYEYDYVPGIDNPGADTRELHAGQTRYLDCYAISQGETDWNSLVTASMQSRDYTRLEGIVSIPGILPPSSSGEAALCEEIAHLGQTGRPYAIVDSTEFRLAPEVLAPMICNTWSITQDERMVDWQGTSEGLRTGQDKPHHKIWYDTFLGSTHVLPPTETPIQPSKFPRSVCDHLLRVDLPAYYHLFTDANQLRSGEDVLRRQFISEGGPVTIGDIDPLYALLIDPTLANDVQFMDRNHSLLDEVSSIYSPVRPTDEITLPRQARR